MFNLVDFAKKLLNVSELLNNINVKGIENVRTLNKAYDECQSILLEIKDVIETYENENKTEKTSDEVGEEDHE